MQSVFAPKFIGVTIINDHIPSVHWFITNIIKFFLLGSKIYRNNKWIGWIKLDSTAWNKFFQKITCNGRYDNKSYLYAWDSLRISEILYRYF